MKQKNSAAYSEAIVGTRKIDFIDGMALLTLIALPFLMYYLWEQHVPPLYGITMTQDACEALAFADALIKPAPKREGCTATRPLDLHNPLEKFPAIYFKKNGIRQELMVSPNQIISAMPLNN